MNLSDLESEFKELEWSTKKDDAGDLVCELGLSHSTISVIPVLKSITGAEVLNFSTSASDILFDSVVSRIYSSETKHWPLVTTSRRIKSPKISVTQARDLIAETINWASQQNLKASYSKLAEYYLGRTGQGQLYHLAALAIAGEVDVLHGYQDLFKKNMAKGFVPMIKGSHIDIAVSLGYDSLAGELGNTTE